MKRKINFVMVVLMLGLSFVMTACSQSTEKSNLVIINNSSNDLKNIAIICENESMGVMPADNSLIKPNDDVTFSMTAHEFQVVVTDAFGHEFTSQTFDLDFSTDQVYTISITQNTSAELFFTVIE